GEWNQAMRGSPEAALVVLRAPLPPNHGNPLAPAMLAELCLAVEDQKSAPALYRELLFADGRMAVIGPVLTLGPVSFFLGGLAALMGDRPRAARHLDDAIAMCERMRAEPFLARALVAQGRNLRQDDPARAALLVERARVIAERLDLPRVRAEVQALSGSRPAAPQAAPSLLTLARDGEYWTLALVGARTRLRDSKGLAYLDELVRAPNREVHVAQLVAGGGSAELADGGPLLDPKARRAYEERLEDLEEELREAESFGDAGRASRAEAE